MVPKLTLDELYMMVARIYGEQNSQRPASATFSHFVEVCGMLAMHARNKKRETVTLEGALCKALAWYFPLMAKFRVKSVEDLVFRKYPYACPYCRRETHVDAICKTVRGTEVTVNHDELRSKYRENQNRRPKGLNDWQHMFSVVYPRTLEDRESRSIAGLFEELGELAEAIRVFDRYPKYFAGEAADVFSYLMGVANEHDLKLETQGGSKFSFEDEFIKRYPGLCVQCGSSVCVCPNVPEATVGRLAKEQDIDEGQIFGINPVDFQAAAENAANRVLSALGGYEGIGDNFPFDRGQANKALVKVCLRLASRLNPENSSVAEKLRSAAIQLSQSETRAGTSSHLDLRGLLKEIKDAISEVNGIKEDLLEDVGKELQSSTINVLLVSSNPEDQTSLGLQREQRAIERAIRQSTQRESIYVKVLPSATVDDLRTEMMKRDYAVVHFLGHADGNTLVFEKEDGTSDYVEMGRVREFVQGHAETTCLILNACSSLESMDTAITPVTVGMSDTVDDKAAIEFARGFYDAVGEGKSFQDAVEYGRECAALKNLGDKLPLKVLVALPQNT